MIDISPYLQGVSSQCPKWLLDELSLVHVEYFSFDQRIKTGQIIVHKTLATDIRDIFILLLAIKFPIALIKPLSDPMFWLDGQWSDQQSMLHNNTCSFNYRKIAGKNKLSTHALGMAIDINPLQNPWIKDGKIIPTTATYDITAQGTLYQGSPAVKIFEDKGFFWGGNFKELKDYHHFERKTKGYECYFMEN